MTFSPSILGVCGHSKDEYYSHADYRYSPVICDRESLFELLSTLVEKWTPWWDYFLCLVDQVRSGLTLVATPVLSILSDNKMGGIYFGLPPKTFDMPATYSKIFFGGVNTVCSPY